VPRPHIANGTRSAMTKRYVAIPIVVRWNGAEMRVAVEPV
jgi:hypothetical protein